MSISVDLARRVMEACKQRASELRSPVSIAIVDAGGHLVLFERMMAPYGFATGNISLAKANTAVMFNQSTDSVAQWGASIPGFASSLAAMTEGKFIMAAGGWPIRVNGTTIGGIGISGGNAPGRDDEIARAGLAVLERGASQGQPAPALYTASVAPVQVAPAAYAAPPIPANSYGEQTPPAVQPAYNENVSPPQHIPTTQHLPASEDDQFRSTTSTSLNEDHPGDQL